MVHFDGREFLDSARLHGNFGISRSVLEQVSISGNDIAAMHRAQTLAKRLRIHKAVIFRCAQNHGRKPRQASDLSRRGNFEKMHNVFRGVNT